MILQSLVRAAAATRHINSARPGFLHRTMSAAPLLASTTAAEEDAVAAAAVTQQQHMPPLEEPAAAAAAAAWTPEQQRFMQLALEQAREALRVREVPIGCVFVRDGQVIGSGFNMTNHTRNATRHAELEAIDRILQDHGGDLSAVGFPRCQLYVTIEPCIMCAGALSLLGIGQVIYGAANDKFGGCGSILDIHQQGCGSCGRHSDSDSAAAAPDGGPFPTRGGLFAQEAIALLQDFYIAGNPAAPKPHRPLMEVPPWEQQQQQQHQGREQP